MPQHTLQLTRTDFDAAQVHGVVAPAQRVVVAAGQALHLVAVPPQEAPAYRASAGESSCQDALAGTAPAAGTHTL